MRHPSKENRHGGEVHAVQLQDLPLGATRRDRAAARNRSRTTSLTSTATTAPRGSSRSRRTPKCRCCRSTARKRCSNRTRSPNTSKRRVAAAASRRPDRARAQPRMDRLRDDVRERGSQDRLCRHRGGIRRTRGEDRRAFRQARGSAREARQRGPYFNGAEAFARRRGLRAVPAALYLHGLGCGRSASSRNFRCSPRGAMRCSPTRRSRRRPFRRSRKSGSRA